MSKPENPLELPIPDRGGSLRPWLRRRATRATRQTRSHSANHERRRAEVVGWGSTHRTVSGWWRRSIPGQHEEGCGGRANRSRATPLSTSVGVGLEARPRRSSRRPGAFSGVGAGECGSSSDQPSDKRRCARVHVHAGGYKPLSSRGVHRRSSCTGSGRGSRSPGRTWRGRGSRGRSSAVHSSLSRTTLLRECGIRVLEIQCAKRCANWSQQAQTGRNQEIP